MSNYILTSTLSKCQIRTPSLGTGCRTSAATLVGRSSAGAGSSIRVYNFNKTHTKKNADNNNNSNNMNYQSIQINGVTRTYLLININLNNISNIKNVLLCFPGGGESISEFIEYTSFNYIDSPVIVFLGQLSLNTYSWQNAFPWLYNNFNQNGITLNYQNDITFVDTVLSKIFGNKIPDLFLTGKSDGGGFCVLYPNISKYKSNVKAIGICSSAHFGLNSVENIDSFDINNNNSYFKGNNNTIIPKNIILPPNISLFIIHGTGDTIMPYPGQNCTGINFLSADVSGSLWSIIDPTVQIDSSQNLINNTYTVNFPDYIKAIIKSNNLQPSSQVPNEPTNGSYSYLVYSNKTNNTVLNFITITNQDHDWSGHYNSGPNSNLLPNFTMDATYLMVKFFKLLIGKYIPTVKPIPSNLLNYTNQIIKF
jgi:poly(3-hydroxybutyrate) depolymerase